MSQDVRAGLERMRGLGPEIIRDEDVPGEGATRLEHLPRHRPSGDLPQDVLPRLQGGVEPRGRDLTRAEKVGGKLVCQVVCYLCEPSGDHGATQFDAFVPVLRESRA